MTIQNKYQNRHKSVVTPNIGRSVTTPNIGRPLITLKYLKYTFIGLMSVGLTLLPLLTYAQTFEHEYTLEVVRKLPHDNTLFTQGLAILDGSLYESSGLYGRSSVRKYFSTRDTETPQYTHSLKKQYFGEGIVFYRDELIQLTWQAGVAFRYDRYLNPIGKFSYKGQGWGICDTGNGFVTSDGSSILTERNYFNFAPKRTIQVLRHKEPLSKLNALTFRVDPLSGENYIFANVWEEDYIVEIHALSGIVTAQINAEVLTRENRFTRGSKSSAEKVLNGIVYDPTSETFFMTGKNWDWLYQVRLVSP